MKIRVQNDLLLLNIVTGLLVIVITFAPANALRLVLGLPFVLFLPGYTLIAALFPKKNQLDSIERVALSFIFSVVIVSLCGLILNYTLWGVRLYPILIALTFFIVATSLIAWYQRHRVVEVERFFVSLNLSLAPWRGKCFVDKILSLILVLVILGSVGIISYVIAAPKVGERFTEFYILGPEGKAEGYPTEVMVGQEARVVAGIINHEHEDMSYLVEVTVDGIRNSELGPVLLRHEEKWVKEISFTMAELVKNQKVEFVLYKEGKPYRSLYLWVDVIR